MMRFTMIAIITLSILFAGSAFAPKANAQDNDEWIKYVTWKGQVDEMLTLRLEKSYVKADFPVASGYRNADYTYHAEPPASTVTAKVEVKEGRGKVWIRKQYWNKPNNSIQVQIYDEESGYGDYEFTVYIKYEKMDNWERNKFQEEINDAVLVYDVFHMEKALENDDLVNALRWAKSAYEIDRLNWNILNKIGEIYYLRQMEEHAEDVFIILRDNGYLTEENWERFRELNPYEAKKGMEDTEETEDESSTE